MNRWRRKPTSTARLVLVAVGASALAWAQAGAAPGALAPQEVFRAVAPSVFVVHTFDAQGEPLALGSAVALSPTSLVTNHHVVANAVAFRLEQKGKTWVAKLGACDVPHDLCLLLVPGLAATPATLRQATPAQAGERVYAVGAPRGLELSISDGMVSGLRSIGGATLIQTSAAISPGSSGGGLFDTHAQLLGITELARTDGENLNFAVPVEAILALDQPAPAPAKPATSAAKPAARGLVAVQQVCVESLGDGAEAKTAQNLIVAALVAGGKVAVTEECAQADARIKGSVQVTATNEVQSDTERDLGIWDESDSHQRQRVVPGATVSLELRLVDGNGRVLWADAEQSNGNLSSDGVHDAVARVVQRFADALRPR